MLVKLEREELWPYYADWNEHGIPDFVVDIPDDLYNKYKEALGNFFEVLDELKVFLKDD